MKKSSLSLILFFSILFLNAQRPDKYILLKPARVFDGEAIHEGWVVLVKNHKIEQAGAMNFKLPGGTEVIELKNCTLLPG